MKARKNQARGQSLVEIALVLPALLILFMGIAEVGFLLFSHVEVANATREGARRGSLCRVTEECTTLTTSVSSAVYAESETLDMNSGNTTITIQPPQSSIITPRDVVFKSITVTVTYSHTSLFISTFVPMFPESLPVEHSTVMAFE